MSIFFELNQYYRYLRNLKKFKSKQKNFELNSGFTEQLNFYSEFIKKATLFLILGQMLMTKRRSLCGLGLRL